ncbi:MAG: hypothetical protein ACLP0B_07375, partial [Steroidobacteraceae bacterium]
RKNPERCPSWGRRSRTPRIPLPFWDPLSPTPRPCKYLIYLVMISVQESQQAKDNGMGKLAWTELIVLWGFAALVIILDRKNWNK